MAGLVAAFALVLALAGQAKLRSPGPTAAALAALRLPGGRAGARLLGAGELAVAGAALAVGGRWPALLLAAAFGALAVAAARTVATGAGRDCGCFGPVRSPATHWHTAVDVAGVLVGLAAAATGAPGPAAVAAADPARAVALLALSGALAALLVLCMTALPDLLRTTEATR